MTFPKTEAWKIKFNTMEQAVAWAEGKRKFGGCFEQVDGGFMVYWLAVGDKRIAQFAW